MTKFNSDIILYGGPGSGKGTQAELLVKKLKAHHLDMGAEIRHLAQGRSELAKRVKAMTNTGRLIPRVVTKQIVRNYLQLASRQPILFDGYPRSDAQVKDLESLLDRAGRKVVMVYLKLPVLVIRARLLHRANTQGRPDDQNPVVIKRRINIFKNQAKKLLSYFKKTHRLIVVDGDQTVAKVKQTINQALGL